MSYDPQGKEVAQQAKRISQKIDKELKLAKEANDLEKSNKLKVLLLGSADSGKTTVLKQLKILYGTGFTNEERVTMKTKVKRNLIHNMKLLVNGLEKFNIPLERTENQVITLKYSFYSVILNS